MKSPVRELPIVDPERFLLATRDAGYRDLASALNELLDNALQAGASRIDLVLKADTDTPSRASDASSALVAVLDDGSGMTPAELVRSLQFGGSSRFDDRAGLGRFGMGLPNSAVSHARRVEVFSWRAPGHVYYSYLDVDEIVSGRLQGLPVAVRRSLPAWLGEATSKSGTLVVWTRCDRIVRVPGRSSIEEMRLALGRIYRYPLLGGTRILLNGVPIAPVDPLYVEPRTLTHGARRYGAPIVIEADGDGGPGTIEVSFSELPVRRWYGWSTDEKRRRGIVGGGGASIVRAHREIAYGWFFFGAKRREHYDDWWRCEIRFSPALDRMFGVTHSKQGIRPSNEAKQLLSRDLESVARTLNARARAAFRRVARTSQPRASAAASRHDVFLARPAGLGSRTAVTEGLRYRLEHKPIAAREFYAVRSARGAIVVTVNTNHPFFTDVYQRANDRGGCSSDQLDRLLFAAARADLEARGPKQRKDATRLRRAWSDALAAFLRT